MKFEYSPLIIWLWDTCVCSVQNEKHTKAAWVIITKTFLATHKSLSGRSASISPPLNQAIQSHLFIQKQVISHPRWVHISLLFSLVFSLVIPCDKPADRWAYKCDHWSKMTGGCWACCLETVAWQAWQGGPAAPLADKAQAKPGAQEPWLKRGQFFQCIVK